MRGTSQRGRLKRQSKRGVLFSLVIGIGSLISGAIVIGVLHVHEKGKLADEIIGHGNPSYSKCFVDFSPSERYWYGGANANDVAVFLAGQINASSSFADGPPAGKRHPRRDIAVYFYDHRNFNEDEPILTIEIWHTLNLIRLNYDRYLRNDKLSLADLKANLLPK